MKLAPMIRSILGMGFIIIFLLSCGSPSDKSSQIDPANDMEQLSAYFSAAPTGIVSAAAPLSFVLSTPLESIPSEEDLQKVIKLLPTVKAKTELHHNSVLVFTPTEALKPEQDYKVTINLDQLGQPGLEGKLDYHIRTQPQDWSMTLIGYYINDNGDFSYTLNVKTADAVKSSDLIKCFSSESNIDVESVDNRTYNLDFTYSASKARPLSIQYDGAPIQINEKGELALPVKSKDVFDVVLSSYDEAAKLLTLDFSQLLDETQDLSGLVKLNDNDATYRVDNNRLSLMVDAGFNDTQGRFTVSGSLKSASNQPLGSDYNYDIDFSVRVPEISFLDGGHYLPSGADFKVPIKARELSRIRLSVVEVHPDQIPQLFIWNELNYMDHYTLRRHGKLIFDELVDLKDGEIDTDGWSIYGIDLSNRLKKQPGSLYFISADFGPGDTGMPCKKDLANYDYKYKIPESSFYKDKSSYYYQYHYYDGYSYMKRDDPCHISFYQTDRSIERTFVCSDFSIIAKQAGSSYHIAVSDIMDLSPVSQADITLYDLQGAICTEGQTGSDGLGVLYIKDDRKAHVLRVEKGRQITYLGLGTEDVNTLVDYDVSGDRTETESGFFVYSERAVYRPGDDIHFNVMVNTATRQLPKGLPISMRFYDSNNQLVDEKLQNIQLDKQQIYTFKTSTSRDAITGRYSCEFKVGTETFRHAILVETIRPNSTTVSIKPDHHSDGRIDDHQLSGTIQVQYLTGFNLTNANIVAYGHFQPLSEPFSKHRDFTFGLGKNADPSLELFNVNTDRNGQAYFANRYDFTTYHTPVKVNIDIETSLPAGGMNKAGKSLTVSPYASYVGVKNMGGGGWAGNYFTTDKIVVQAVNVNREGNLLSSSNTLDYTLYKHRDYWWVDKYRINQMSHYRRSQNWNKVSEGQKSITGRGSIDIMPGTLERGTYKIEVRDRRSGQTSSTFFVVYEQDSPIPGQEPHLLEFDLDKDECTAGETVNIKLPGIVGAKALISIERGKDVLAQFWQPLTNSEQTFEINTKEEWAPNIYIHMTVIQPYMQDVNDLPLRLYGLKSIKVNPQAPDLQPEIKTDDRFESNRQYSIKVSEAKKRPMSYTLSIVDEGLLNITGFQTPDPVIHFGGRFPLLVRTWDIYKYLMRYFKVKYAGIIAIGGDDTYNPDALPEISRFDPVSMHLGPFKLKSGETQSHQINIPNYIGKVRIMVVACHDGQFGSNEAYVPVRNPIMLQSQFPRALNVTDQLRLPVTIFKDDPSINSVTLSASATEGMLSGLKASAAINLKGKDEHVHNYDVAVLDKSGQLDLELTLAGGGKTMTEKTKLIVHYPNTYSTTSKQVVIAPGDNYRHTIKVKGYPEAFESTITVGGARLPDIANYAEELIDYPYGCLEQVVSSGFAQLYLDKILSLSPEKNKRRLEHLNSVIKMMSTFSNNSGHFTYWPGGYYDAWADLYAGNFLMACSRMNYIAADADLILTWSRYHQNKANRWRLAEVSNNRVYESESLIQAYRLYLLAKMGSPSKSAMNAFIAENTSENQLTWWLIAGAYQLSGYETKALEVMDKAQSMSLDRSASNLWSYLHFGSQARDLAVITEVLSSFPSQRDKAEQYYNSMVDLLNGANYVNTQTKGYAFKAAYAFYGEELQGDGVSSYEWLQAGKSQNFNHSAMQPASYPIRLTGDSLSFTIKNTGGSNLYLRTVNRYISDDLFRPSSSKNMDMNVTYLRSNESLGSSFTVKRGDYIDIIVSVSNTSGVPQNHMALNVRAPSGFELINPAIYQTQDISKNSGFTYQSFKDDRVYTFFNAAAGEKKQFTFRAKAAFYGDFYNPSVSCENMYDGKVYARSNAGRVAIKD